MIKFQTQISMMKEFDTENLDQVTCTAELFLDFITFMKDFEETEQIRLMEELRKLDQPDDDGFVTVKPR